MSYLKKLNHIVGIEARGFIIGSALAAIYDKGFIPIRKQGKLPPPTINQEYELEYGKDILEIKPLTMDKNNVIIVDDVLATGGTLNASIELCKKAGYNVIDVVCLVNLKYVHKNNYTWNWEGHARKVKSVVDYY